MKTRKELEKRYEELVLEMQKWNKMFEAYGGTETKVNDWEGIIEETRIRDEMIDEKSFIEKAIKYLF